MTTVFAGCSFTFGKGFSLEREEPGLWVNLLHKNLPALSKTQLINVGESGASNERIFYNVSNAILAHKPKYAFVQWTSAPRYNVCLGVETYTTKQYFGFDGTLHDHNLHSVNYSANYLESIRNRFLSLHHPHGSIINIIEYTTSLINLATLTDTRIFFLNGICPWDNNFFVKLEDTLPNSYTEYTKKLLETESRDDEEVFQLYNNIHQDYQQAGGIHETYWINLYNSFASNKVDTNDDGTHPGIKSNQLYLELVKQSLNSKL